MWLKVNLHVHTNLSDGRYSPYTMAYKYEKKGYGAIAITDHDRLFNIDTIRDLNILILPGVEHSIGEHWLEIKGKHETLTVKAHPNRYGDTIQEVDMTPYDVVEATEHSILYPEYLKCKKHAIVTDDSHNINMIDKAWIIVYVEKVDKDLIIKSIKEGKYALGGII